jgi:NADH-quinone oxidoreductase subunit M
MTRREIWIAAPLLAFAILFGVYPRAVLDYITPSVQKTVTEIRTVPEHIAAAVKAKDASAQPQEPIQP